MRQSSTCFARLTEPTAAWAPLPALSGGKGFTLVEMLAALSVFALLSIILMSALLFGSATWKREQRLERETYDVSAVQTTLRRLLSNAYPLYRRIDDHHGVVAFSGGKDRLEFLAPTPEALGGAGLTRFILEMSEGPGGRSVVVRAQPELTLHRDVWVTSVLAAGVDGLRLSYNADDPAPAAWVPSWAGMSKLPKLVRVEIGLPRQGHVATFETTVALTISADAQCVYAADASHDCRDR